MIRTLKILTVLLVLAIYIVPAAKANIYIESINFEDLQDQRTFSLFPDYRLGQSENRPGWGNYYAKGGVVDIIRGRKGDKLEMKAYNNTFVMDDFAKSIDKLDFIYNPNNSPPVVPEPISSTLFIVGGIALGFRQFRKKKRTA